MPNAIKVIENPEVPGLECLLPPPPPPPPITESKIEEVKATSISGKPEKHVENAVLVTSAKSKIPLEEIERVVSGDFKKTELTMNVAEVPNTTITNVARPFAIGGPPVFPEAIQASYFGQPPAEQLSGVEQPWWIPTESDTAEVAPQNPSWMEKNISSWTEPNQKNTSLTIKAKGKFFKRKSECIDPAQDAERVANAQRELSALMKPLQCDLCNAIMNSTLQAKLHYEGKPHQKKVSMFLNQSVKKIKPDDGQVTSTTSNTDWNTFCEVCKTWFTSQIDASQHYAGKKHIRATTGGIRQKTKKHQSQNQATVEPTGRFGTPLSTEILPATVGIVDIPLIPPIASPVVSPINNYQTPAWPFPTFRCELCGVTANRLEQLETHKRGARHMKMLKMNGLPNLDVEEINDSTTSQPAPSSIDYSIYRTPSGQYYCAPCNRSFHSENSFAQHIDSKKHKTQVNPKQPTPTVVAAKKSNKSAK